MNCDLDHILDILVIQRQEVARLRQLELHEELELEELELAKANFRTTIRQAYEAGASYSQISMRAELTTSAIKTILQVDRESGSRPL